MKQLAESDTWPEHGYAAVDVFSCGVSLDHGRIREETQRALPATTVDQRVFARGATIVATAFSH